MRSYSWIVIVCLVASSATAQDQQAPQTARQALIEMFFGTGPDHVKKHLPDATRNTLKKLSSGNAMSMLDAFEMFASQAKNGSTKIQTFDTGPKLVVAHDPQQNGDFEITVERDDLSSDEDQIEVALHITKEPKEQRLPFIPHFAFTMKQEADVWRLNEISITVRLPLADPEFLNNLEDRQRAENEQMGIYAMHSIISAEIAVHSVRGTYACSLSDLRKAAADAKPPIYALSPDLASGKSGSYVFAITGCDGNQYKLAAEPAAPDSGQRAFCADESGTVRGSGDGKATTCLQSGAPVPDQVHGEIRIAPQAEWSTPVEPKTPVSGIVGDQPGGPFAVPAGRPEARVRVPRGFHKTWSCRRSRPFIQLKPRHQGSRVRLWSAPLSINREE